MGNSQQIAAKHYLQVTDEHFAKATQNPTQSRSEISKPDGKPVIRPPRDNEKAPEFPGLSAACRLLRNPPVPPQGAEQSQDLAGNPSGCRQDDALSDARLIELVETWAGLPDGVKDRIAELVASAGLAMTGAEKVASDLGR